jgi:hypothetical protein
VGKSLNFLLFAAKTSTVLLKNNNLYIFISQNNVNKKRGNPKKHTGQ